MKNELLIEEMNRYLANLHVLYTKLHNYHWNVVGDGFFTLHAKLEELYGYVAETIDEVAERIIMAHGKADASMIIYLEKATIAEAESEAISSKKIIKQLLSDFEILLAETTKIHEIASAGNDSITASMIEGSMSNYQKQIWMMNAYLN